MGKVLKCLTLLVSLLTIGLHSGCALYPQSNQLLENPPKDLPVYDTLADVPFFPQDAYQCGPAALAMLLNYKQRDSQPSDLVSKVYVPEKRGTFQIELRAATRSYGLVPYVVPRTVEAVFREVAAGNPVLVLQNLGLEIAPQWHYSVVIGYDLVSKEVILHSGLEESTRMALGTFERSWANSAPSWGMLALLPSQLPSQITPAELAQNAEDMDSVGQSKAAITIYEAGLDRWPGNNLLTFGCGNLHYKNGAYEAASQRFLSMLDLVPDDVRAWNNLAYSLAELGCQQAIAAAQCAVNLGRRSALHSQATSGTLLDIETTLAQETNNSKSCFSLPSCPL